MKNSSNSQRTLVATLESEHGNNKVQTWENARPRIESKKV
jgi:hypothetical protein